jgi:hypothetical protein
MGCAVQEFGSGALESKPANMAILQSWTRWPLLTCLLLPLEKVKLTGFSMGFVPYCFCLCLIHGLPHFVIPQSSAVRAVQPITEKFKNQQAHCKLGDSVSARIRSSIRLLFIIPFLCFSSAWCKCTWAHSCLNHCNNVVHTFNRYNAQCILPR